MTGSSGRPPLLHIFRKEGEALCGRSIVPIPGGGSVFRDGKVAEGVNPIDVCVFCQSYAAARHARKLHYERGGRNPEPPR